MEQHLISAAINSRRAFETLTSRNIESELSPSAQIIFEQMRKYYESDSSVDKANAELVAEYIKESYPKFYQQLKSVLMSLPDSSGENAVALWLRHKRKEIGQRLASALADNRVDDEKVKALMEEYEFYKSYVVEEIQRTLSGVSAEELLESENRDGLIPLYPRCINDALGGGIDRGEHIIVFGRPDYGKTQFIINAVSVMLSRGFKVLYCCNEEPPKKILLRIISRLADKDVNEVKASPGGAFDLAVDRGYNNLVVHQMLPGTPFEIDAMVAKVAPDVVIVDQLRNLKIRGTVGLTQKLEEGGQFMRTIGSKHNVAVISVTQAGESAHNKLNLDYNDVDSSNTGLAATADHIIGVARNEEFRAKSMVVLCICKTKGGTYGQFPVHAIASRSKLRSNL